jgi:hypothetical protein
MLLVDVLPILRFTGGFAWLLPLGAAPKYDSNGRFGPLVKTVTFAK